MSISEQTSSCCRWRVSLAAAPAKPACHCRSKSRNDQHERFGQRTILPSCFGLGPRNTHISSFAARDRHIRLKTLDLVSAPTKQIVSSRRAFQQVRFQGPSSRMGHIWQLSFALAHAGSNGSLGQSMQGSEKCSESLSPRAVVATLRSRTAMRLMGEEKCKIDHEQIILGV